METDRKDVLMRLRRIEGQVRGLQRMVEGQADCSDILVQVGAVTAAMKKVGSVIVRGYMEECLQNAEGAPKGEAGQTLRDFHKALSQYIGWA
jgi:CsoR family transcriptional regulator, copper-sensing transcriptional repressor